MCIGYRSLLVGAVIPGNGNDVAFYRKICMHGYGLLWKKRHFLSYTYNVATHTYIRHKTLNPTHEQLTKEKKVVAFKLVEEHAHLILSLFIYSLVLSKIFRFFFLLASFFSFCPFSFQCDVFLFWIALPPSFT